MTYTFDIIVDLIYVYDEWGYFKALSEVPDIPVETDTPHILVGNDDRSIRFVTPDCRVTLAYTGREVHIRPVFYTGSVPIKEPPGTKVLVDGIPCHVIDARTLLCDNTCDITEEFYNARKNGFDITEGGVFDAFSKLLSTDKFRKKLMEA